MWWSGRSVVRRSGPVSPSRSSLVTDLPNPLDVILNRRSDARLVAPGPDAEQLDLLLQAATTVPDHNTLRPYRFVVVPEDGQERFGNALASAVAAAALDVAPEKLAKARSKAFVAPCRIVLIASPRPHKVPEWEQVATAACCGYAIALAAAALGLGAVWRSAGVMSGGALDELLGLDAGEQVLGWVNIGTRTVDPAHDERRPVDLDAFVTVVGADGPRAYRA